MRDGIQQDATVFTGFAGLYSNGSVIELVLDTSTNDTGKLHFFLV